MSRSFTVGVFGAMFCCMILLSLVAAPTWGQMGSVGAVDVTVLDQSRAAVQGADLALTDLAMNDVRNAKTEDRGTYRFVDLSVGMYKLTVSKAGFESQVYGSITVQAARVTDVRVTLKGGAPTEKVEVVESATPLVETTTNTIGATIDMKQIEDLPLGGRDITQLANLMPGTTLLPGTGPTWNGLPSIAQGNNIDGVISSSSRMKFGGNAAPQVKARIEDIEEMTVQTDQMDMNQGFGQTAMQINFVTRRGSNAFHGRAYEDFQNSYLNANSWFNDAAGIPKRHSELNDFGVSVGGPILRDKLFFFGSYSENKSPGTIFPSATVLTSAAQSGNFTYLGTDNVQHTVNVYTLAQNYSATLPTTMNSVIQSQMAIVNNAEKSGTLTPLDTDPNLKTLTWSVPNAITNYFPTVRVDYIMSQKFRFNFAWNMTYNPSHINGTNASFFPGPTANGQAQYTQTRNYTTAFGFDWTVRPTLVNQFRGGFFYNWTTYTNSQEFASQPQVNWANNSGVQIATSPTQYFLGSGSYYPVLNASDTMTWQHGAHTLSYGFSWWREQDHYYNPPGGVYGIALGLVSADPAFSAFTLSTLPASNNANVTEAQALYATLVGRIAFAGTNGGPDYYHFAGNAVNLKTGQYNPPGDVATYNLDELIGAYGLFFQDSYHLKPNLTVNLGLRWDFTADDHDLTAAYHGITSVADMYGPSGVGNLFRPGTLTGNPLGGTLRAQGHQYHGWDVSPQPQIGIAWSPRHSRGALGKLLGGSSVIRAGFGLRRFTEPQRYFWDNATDYGAFFFQQFSLTPNTSAGPGYFTPGSLSLGNTIPLTSYSYVPQSYLASVPESQFEFVSGAPGLAGIDPNIKQPYNQSWNLGIERPLGKSNAIEIRYLGSRAVHQWIALDLNEVNIFENGFLNQFEQAQENMKINAAHGYVGSNATFANLGFTGEAATPIFDAAFAGEPTGVRGALTDYGFPSFLTDLQQGQAGALANALTGISNGRGGANYFCNLVGASFAPCGVTLGYTGAGAGYPINYFQVNPYYTNSSTSLMMAGGYSNYNGLQVDLRHNQWRGIQFDLNYTWSHNLGLNSPNSWTASFNQLTLRDLHLGYGPTIYDFRHVIHANGTYDLPFGKGKMFLNHGGLADRAAGGWTIATIFTFQTGIPFNITGGYNTYNDYADGGVVLNGITRSQLQSAVCACRVPGTTYVKLFNSTVMSYERSMLTPNSTPGTIVPPIWLYGPHNWYDDIAVTKKIPIRENLRFSLQGEFLNAFNHPTFNPYSGNLGVLNPSFGVDPGYNSTNASGRTIEIRANLEF
jgi:hypothetical protein